MDPKLKYAVVVVGILVVIYLVNRYSSKETFSETTNNKSVVNQENNNMNSSLQEIPYDTSNDNYSYEESSVQPSVSLSETEHERLKAKFASKNKSKYFKYTRSNYAEGDRTQDNDDIAKYFNDNNALVENGHNANDEYTGRDETNDLYASYTPGQKKPLTDDEIFKADNFLPQEAHNKEWFDVMPEPISIKNKHLINVSRPVGVNTIGNSLRNPSYDIRGTPPCPKFVVSPWQQSTIEPDHNIRGLC